MIILLNIAWRVVLVSALPRLKLHKVCNLLFLTQLLYLQYVTVLLDAVFVLIQRDNKCPQIIFQNNRIDYKNLEAGIWSVNMHVPLCH